MRIVQKAGLTGIPVEAILTPWTSEDDGNLECSIDTRDFSIVAGAWGDVLPRTPSRADVDHDGVVGAFDGAAVRAAWTPRE